MHELGHNLGLHHGGADDINYKPNYLSVMNYFFQTDGLLVPPGAARVDYTHALFGDLNELDLDETQPITVDPAFAGWNTLFFCPGKLTAGDPVSISRPIDWACHTPPVFSVHVPAHISGSVSPTTLHGSNDWGGISKSLAAGLSPAVNITGIAPASHTSADGELNLAKANLIQLPPIRDLTAVSNNGAVALSWSPLLQSRVVGYKITKTDSSGAQMVATTIDPSYVDGSKPTGAGGISYDVQALYLPHGAAETFKITKTPAGAAGFSVQGNEVAIASEDILEPKGLVTLRQRARTALKTMSSGAGAGAGAQALADAMEASTATLVLQTKPVSISVR